MALGKVPANGTESALSSKKYHLLGTKSSSKSNASNSSLLPGENDRFVPHAEVTSMLLSSSGSADFFSTVHALPLLFASLNINEPWWAT